MRCEKHNVYHRGSDCAQCVDEKMKASLPDDIATLKEVECEHINRALKLHKGNVTSAAKALGIGRATLYRKVTDYGIVLCLLLIVSCTPKPECAHWTERRLSQGEQMACNLSCGSDCAKCYETVRVCE